MYVKMSFEYEWKTVKSKSKRIKNSHGKKKDPPAAYITKLTISEQKKKPLLALLQKKKLITGSYVSIGTFIFLFLFVLDLGFF